MRPELTHIDHWIFDLDNTLYPASCALFTQVSARMTEYVAAHFGISLEAARPIQRDYFLRYGTTLNGMMREQGVDPHHYLDFVHDIDFSALPSLENLAARIAALPGRKIIFTNADAPYARKVLSLTGLEGMFDHIHDIHDSAFLPKPHAETYHAMLAATGAVAERSAFFEDMAINLKPAKALGMTTVWIDSGEAWARDADAGAAPEYVDHVTSDLESWLEDWQPAPETVKIA